MTIQNLKALNRGLRTEQFISQVSASVALCVMNVLPRTAIGVFTLFIYAAISSLRTDLFLFCFPEQSSKGRVLIYPGPSYYFFQVNTIIRSHKGKRVQVERSWYNPFLKIDRKLFSTAKRCYYVHQDVLFV